MPISPTQGQGPGLSASPGLAQCVVCSGCSINISHVNFHKWMDQLNPQGLSKFFAFLACLPSLAFLLCTCQVAFDNFPRVLAPQLNHLPHETGTLSSEFLNFLYALLPPPPPPISGLPCSRRHLMFTDWLRDPQDDAKFYLDLSYNAQGVVEFQIGPKPSLYAPQ